MKNVVAYFHMIVQDSQEFGSDDEHMISRVFFSLEVDGKRHDDLVADIKQAVGSSYESGPLEVYRPKGYRGPLNYEPFRLIVEHYYRSVIGSGGNAIRLHPEAKRIRMQDNLFEIPYRAEFQGSDGDFSW